MILIIIIIIIIDFSNAQYIPPELSLHSTYHGDLVDVWVLGISLYRMLVGKYPFSAKNDRRLFNKMQQADFSIPQELTDGKFYIYIYI